MTTDILLHSEHGSGCPSGFITKERENKENWERIREEKMYNKIGRAKKKPRKKTNKPSKETEKQITIMYGEYY